MYISSSFCSGNIDVQNADRPDDIQLAIRKDHNSDFYQWFHYRVTGSFNVPLTMRIMNAGGSAYTDGWKDYQACASYDRETWFRVPTSYDGKVLTIEHTPEEDAIYYAYFAPYSMERHHDLIADCLASPLVTHHMLGHTLDGQDLDLLEIASEDGKVDKLTCWFIARQHPGETMAEWWMEGFLERLLDADDPVSKSLLNACDFYVVPNMNPDGSARGHLRTNAAGANLNREWKDATMEKSPEVYLVRAAMKDIGVDFHMDVHGDEALPYNFLAGFEGIPNLTEGQQECFEHFKETFAKISPDFQTKYGYPTSAPNSANMSLCTNYTASTFDAVSMTLEMPFKDNANLPDPLMGWSAERSSHLGRAVIDTLWASLPMLLKRKA